MTISRRHFLRGSAQLGIAAPLLGAAAPLFAAPPPAGIDYSLITKPFAGKKVSAKDITEKDVGGLALFAGSGCNVVALAGKDGALLVDGGQAVNSALLLKAVHRKLGAKIELDKTPDWPPQGPPIATAVYDSVLWPVESVVTR